MPGDEYIGATLAICSSLAVGTSYVTTKVGLKDARQRHGFQGDGFEYVRSPIWWTGMTLLVVGEAFNFAAYAFAPAVLVTPLGALSVLTGTVLGAYFLEERLNVVGRLGCAMCLIGSVLIVANAPPERKTETVQQIVHLAVQPGFLLFCFATTVFTVGMIYIVCPRYGTLNPVFYLSVCAATGAVSVMALKAFGIAVKLTLAGQNQFLSFSTYLFGIVAVGCIVVQMNYFNKALGAFPQSLVSPIYYVTFTVGVLTASWVLFQGFNVTDTVKTVSLFSGFVTIFSGVYLLNFPSGRTSGHDLSSAVLAERVLTDESEQARAGSDEAVRGQDQMQEDERARLMGFYDTPNEGLELRVLARYSREEADRQD